MGATEWDGKDSVVSFRWFIACLLIFVLFSCLFLVLRKQARKLENDIDMKLVAYSKIGTSTMPSTSADTAPLLNEHVFDSLSMEIEQMLDKVSASHLPKMNPPPIDIFDNFLLIFVLALWDKW